MARGLQKVQAQQKSREAQAAKAGGKSQLKSRAEAFKIKCPKCFNPLSDYKNSKEHWEAKHGKDPLPTEESLPKA